MLVECSPLSKILAGWLFCMHILKIQEVTLKKVYVLLHYVVAKWQVVRGVMIDDCYCLYGNGK